MPLPTPSNFPILDPLQRWYGYSPHPSDVLKQKGIEYLDEIEQDPHLKGQLNTRARSAIIPGWKIEPAPVGQGDRRQNMQIRDFVAWTLDSIEGTFLHTLLGFCDAFGKGFVVKEPQWKKIERGKWQGKIQLDRLTHIPQKFIGFDCDTTGRVKDDGIVLSANSRISNPKIRYPYHRFLHLTHGHTSNPYGDPLDLRCAFAVWIKRENTKFWAVCNETFGMPAVKVELPANAQGTDTDLQEKAEKIVRDFRGRSGVAVPKGFILELLQAQRSGSADYLNLNDFCNKEISKIILGATLSVESAGTGQSGGYSLGKQHGEITSAYARFDAIWLEYVVNRYLIPLIVDLNFETDSYPVFEIPDDSIGDLVGNAQALSTLAQIMDIPDDWARQRLRIPEPAAGQKLLVPVQQITSQPGLDNKLFRFSNPPSSLIPHPSSLTFASDRETLLDNLEQQTLDQIGPELVKIFDKTLKTVEQLPEGQRPTSIPILKLNVGPLKKLFMRAEFAHYLYGKAEATQQLTDKGIEVPGVKDKMPDLPKAFRSPPRSMGELRGAAKFEIDSGNLIPLDPNELITALSLDVALSADELSFILPVYDEAAAQIAGLLKTDIQKIFTNAALNLQEGWTLREFTQSIRDELIKYAGDVFGRATAGQEMAGHHIELVYRNMVNKSYRDGIDRLADDVDSIVWGFRYNAILDNRVRDSHAELDGVVLPKDDPFWQKYKPPWEHNCRCTRELVTVDDIQSGAYQQTPADNIPQPAGGF